MVKVESEQMQKFDISEVVRARVREMFRDIIPDEVLDDYLQREVKAFFADRRESRGYHRPDEVIPHTSQFAALVREEVGNYLKEHLAEDIRTKLATMLAEVGVEGLVAMIGKAKAQYDAEITARLYQQLFDQLSFKIGDVIGQMKRNGQL